MYSLAFGQKQQEWPWNSCGKNPVQEGFLPSLRSFGIYCAIHMLEHTRFCNHNCLVKWLGLIVPILPWPLNSSTHGVSLKEVLSVCWLACWFQTLKYSIITLDVLLWPSRLLSTFLFLLCPSECDQVWIQPQAALLSGSCLCAAIERQQRGLGLHCSGFFPCKLSPLCLQD